MAPTIFPSRLLSDVQGYGTIFLGRIHERQWYGLVYDNSDGDTFYCPDLVRSFYLGIDNASINQSLNQFTVHLDHGNLLLTIEAIEEVTRCLPLLSTLPPFLYMSI